MASAVVVDVAMGGRQAEHALAAALEKRGAEVDGEDRREDENAEVEGRL
jgi:hypothetical protein